MNEAHIKSKKINRLARCRKKVKEKITNERREILLNRIKELENELV